MGFCYECGRQTSGQILSHIGGRGEVSYPFCTLEEGHQEKVLTIYGEKRPSAQPQDKSQGEPYVTLPWEVIKALGLEAQPITGNEGAWIMVLLKEQARRTLEDAGWTLEPQRVFAGFRS